MDVDQHGIAYGFPSFFICLFVCLLYRYYSVKKKKNSSRRTSRPSPPSIITSSLSHQYHITISYHIISHHHITSHSCRRTSRPSPPSIITSHHQYHITISYHIISYHITTSHHTAAAGLHVPPRRGAADRAAVRDGAADVLMALRTHREGRCSVAASLGCEVLNEFCTKKMHFFFLFLSMVSTANWNDSSDGSWSKKWWK